MTRWVAAVAVGALALSGCSGDAPDPTALATDDCAAPEEPALQEGGHLLGDQPPPVPWSSVPPTSGWHASGRGVDPGAYTEPVSEAQQVLWLEKGGVVVAYDPDLGDEVVASLQQLPSRIDNLVVTPYDVGMPTPIAMTAWGVVQRCDTLSADDARAFRDAYADRGPEH